MTVKMTEASVRQCASNLSRLNTKVDWWLVYKSLLCDLKNTAMSISSKFIAIYERILRLIFK